MDFGVVDGANGRVRVSVGGKENALRIRVQVHGLADKLDPRHVRHALVHQEKADRIVSLFQTPQRFERRRARLGAQHSVAVRVMAPQVALHRTQDFRVVVNGQQYGLCHSLASEPRAKWLETAGWLLPPLGAL